MKHPTNLLEVCDVSFKRTSNFELRPISFTISEKQKIAIVGRSGSGKSTLLQIIAGLHQPDEGIVYFNGKRILGPNEKLIPGNEGIAYLSQHFELLHNYKIGDLLAYRNNLDKKTNQSIIEVCRIGHLLERKTSDLSGGEKQRVATAKMLTTSPKLMMLDEPFSNLDPELAETMKTMLSEIGEVLGCTCVITSHNPYDTLPWADKILVLKDGHLHSSGSPVVMYQRPKDIYMAALFGTFNLLTISQSAAIEHILGERLPSPIVRPEQFKLQSKNSNLQSSWLEATVKHKYYYGSHYALQVWLLDGLVWVRTDKSEINVGDSVYLAFQHF